MHERAGPDNQTLYVETGEAERGADAPFYTVYRDPDANTRWGYVCGNCDSFATAMDSMGRIKCSDCANMKKPDEWDATHE